MSINMTPSLQKVCVIILVSTLSLNRCTSLEFSKIIYDDSYITSNLDDRYPYLKLDNGSYIPPKDYFNFTNVYEPSADYFETVNIENHLFNELKAMEISSSIATMDQWHYSDEEEMLYSNLPEANEVKCSQELEYIADKLNRASKNSSYLFEKGFENIQLLRYIDSWGRPASETYYGHTYWIGSYRGCRDVFLPRNNEKQIEFRYCWGKLRARDWPAIGSDGDVIPPISFRVGLCLPKTCDTRTANYKRSLIQHLMEFNFSPLHKNRFNNLFDIYCLPTKTATFNQDDLSLEAKIFLTTILIWLIIICLLSISNHLFELPSTLKALSIQENLSRFVSDDSPPQTSLVDFRSIGIIKFFASLAIIIGHLGCSVGWVFNSSTFSISLNSRKVSRLYFISTMKSVDWFLVIGGIVYSYTIARKFPANKINLIIKPRVYINLLVIRFLRLTPVFIIIITFLKSVYVQLADGPMWDYGTYKYSIQGKCRRSSWWRALVIPILFAQNGNHYQHECLPVSWYVITDLKLFLTAPIVIYLLHNQKNNLKKVTFSIFFILLSTLSQYKDLSMQKMVYFKQFFIYSPLVGTNMLSLAFGEPGYFSAINRSHAFIVGILSGLFLHDYQQKHENRSKKNSNMWPFYMNGWFMKAIILYQIFDFFSPAMTFSHYLQTKQIPNEETIKLAMVLKPRFDSVMFAIITLRLVTDLAPTLIRYSKSFYKLSKLSYCAFLIHSIIIAYVVSANEKSRPDSLELQFLILLAFVTCASFIISFPLYVLFESPFVLLLNSSIKTTKTSALSSTATKTAHLAN